MAKRLLAIGAVALIVFLAGANVVQWRLRAKRWPVQELTPRPDVRATHLRDAPRVPASRARSLILFLGDGMGLNHVHAASLRLVQGGPRARLEMERMPVTGIVRTRSASHLAPDSAAAATALSTGTATRNQTLGLDPDGRPLVHLLERAAAAGRATGIVTTDDLTGATPAGFTVRVGDRDDRSAIARQIVACPYDLMLGGGRSRFEDGGLLDEARTRGWQTARSFEEIRAAGPGRLLALPTEGPLGDDEEGGRLADWTRLAIERLSADPDGFVLLVEDTHIDWRSHDNRALEATDRVLALDEAVLAALRSAPEGTLVLVTADHETGGLAVSDLEGSRGTPAASWGTMGHTGAPVAIFAEGPREEAFTGVLDAAEVGRRLRIVLGLEE